MVYTYPHPTHPPPFWNLPEAFEVVPELFIKEGTNKQMRKHTSGATSRTRAPSGALIEISWLRMCLLYVVDTVPRAPHTHGHVHMPFYEGT